MVMNTRATNKSFRWRRIIGQKDTWETTAERRTGDCIGRIFYDGTTYNVTTSDGQFEEKFTTFKNAKDGFRIWFDGPGASG